MSKVSHSVHQCPQCRLPSLHVIKSEREGEAKCWSCQHWKKWQFPRTDWGRTLDRVKEGLLDFGPELPDDATPE